MEKYLLSPTVKTWDEKEIVAWLVKNNRKDIVKYINQLHEMICEQFKLTQKVIQKYRELNNS
jgi:hypothetical protein